MLRFATGNCPGQPSALRRCSPSAFKQLRLRTTCSQLFVSPPHDHPHSSSVLVTNTRGFDLDDRTILRHPDGYIMRPQSGGWVSCAC
eukprot:4509364-Pyramimonas_sp.AAC.1